MKKLMFAAVAALACTAFAEENGIASENIVGYQAKDFAVGYCVTTPTFEALEADGMDIQKLLPTDPTIEAGKLLLYVSDSTRATIATYQWQPKLVVFAGVVEFPAGWYDVNDASAPAVKKFTYGQGFQIYAEVPVSINYCGQVVTASPKFTATAPGYYRCGNATPVDVDLQKIIPTSTVAPEIEAGKLLLYTFGADRAVAKTYQWQPKLVVFAGVVEFPAGWYDVNDASAPATKIFAPGEGFQIYSELDDVTITFPSPLADAE